MMTSKLILFRLACGAAVAAGGLLPASGAFAQTAPVSYAFDVENFTANNTGDPTFPVADSLTFMNLQINEIFAGGFTQTIDIGSLDTATVGFATPTLTTGGLPVSATLTGNFGPGPAQNINIATGINGATMTQYVSTKFSASLFGPAQSGTALGTFNLLDGSGIPTQTVNIVTPAAVPEASTTVSLGLLLTLGIGALAVSRRRTASAK